jgi:hypothetical protein
MTKKKSALELSDEVGIYSPLMFCHDPSEQVFNLEDKLIGIDWGKNGDKAVQVTFVKESDGRLIVTEVKELEKL